MVSLPKRRILALGLIGVLGFAINTLANSGTVCNWSADEILTGLDALARGSSLSPRLQALSSSPADDAVRGFMRNGTANNPAAMRANMIEAGFSDEIADSAALAARPGNVERGALVRMEVTTSGKKQVIEGEFMGADRENLYFARVYDENPFRTENIAISRNGLNVDQLTWLDSTAPGRNGIGFRSLTPDEIPVDSTIRVHSTRNIDGERIESPATPRTMASERSSPQPGALRPSDIRNEYEVATDVRVEIEQRAFTFNRPLDQIREIQTGLIQGARVEVNYTRPAVDSVKRSQSPDVSRTMTYIETDRNGVTFFDGTEMVELGWHDIQQLRVSRSWVPARRIIHD